MKNNSYKFDDRLPFRVRDLRKFLDWLEKRYKITNEEEVCGSLLLIFPNLEKTVVGTTPSGARATCTSKEIHRLAREFNVFKNVGKQKRNHSFALKTLEKKYLELEIYCAELEERFAVAQEKLEILS